MKQNIRDIITEYVADYPTMTNTALADKILEDKAIEGKSHRTIRYFIGEIKTEQLEGQGTPTPYKFEDTTDVSAFDQALKLSMEEDPDDIPLDLSAPTQPNVDVDWDFTEDMTFDLNEDEEEEEDIPFPLKSSSESIYDLLQEEESTTDAYEVKDLKYKLVVSKVEYLFDVELIDKVFCAYSRKGLNLTKTQITNNLKLTVNELSAIMSKLNLTKESEPFGPFTDEFMEREDIYTVTVNNATSLLDVVKETDSAALEAVIKAYKKAYVEFSNKNLRHDSFIKDIVEGIKDVKVNVTIGDAQPSNNGVLNLAVVLTDMHLGLQLPVYNYEIARQKLKNIAREINAQGADSVSILMLGDTMHTISGVNHAGMWKTIESGAWGSNAIIKAFEILLEFFSSIRNLTDIQSVSGNHDRTVADKELEDSNEGAALLFYMLNLAMPSIEVNHNSHRTVSEVNGLNFILLHGDQGLDKKSADKIVWKYGKQDKFNLILEGHWHSRIISKDDDCNSYRKMHCPAFAPTDDYADRLGLGSASGWLMISEDDGLPRITDIPINYGK